MASAYVRYFSSTKHQISKICIAFSHFLRIINVQKMLPLTDGAGYKLFSASNVPAYRWCGIEIKLFGVKIF